jgi:CheY-like chemotaxis protein
VATAGQKGIQAKRAMVRKPVILIAEDDPKFRELLQLYLEGEYCLLFAKDGLQTIEQVQESSPDLILMDIRMPRLTGWQAVREIRARQKMVPIILITGYPDPLNGHKAETLDVDACLSKPFDFAHLRRLIEERVGGEETGMARH